MNKHKLPRWIILSLLLCSTVASSVNAQHSEASQCTTHIKVKLFWTTVWEKQKTVSCSQPDAESQAFPPAVVTEVVVDSSEAETNCDYESYAFGAVKWCTETARRNEEEN